MTSDLSLLLRELHVVKDAEDNSEEVVPPVLLEGVAITLHDLKHDCETSARSTDKQFSHQSCCIAAQQEQNRHSMEILAIHYDAALIDLL